MNETSKPQYDSKLVADWLDEFAKQHARTKPVESNWQQLFRQLCSMDGLSLSRISKWISDLQREPDPIGEVTALAKRLRGVSETRRVPVEVPLQPGTANDADVDRLVRKMRQTADSCEPSAKTQQHNGLDRSTYHAICEVAEKYLLSQLPNWVRDVRVCLLLDTTDNAPESKEDVLVTVGRATLPIDAPWPLPIDASADPASEPPESGDDARGTARQLAITTDSPWQMEVYAFADRTAEPPDISRNRRQAAKTRFDALATAVAAATRFSHGSKSIVSVILYDPIEKYESWVCMSDPAFVVENVCKVVDRFCNPETCVDSLKKQAFMLEHLSQKLSQGAFADLDVAVGVHGLLTQIKRSPKASQVLVHNAAQYFARFVNQSIRDDTPEPLLRWCESCEGLLPAMQLDDLKLWKWLGEEASESRNPAAWVGAVQRLIGAGASSRPTWQLVRKGKFRVVERDHRKTSSRLAALAGKAESMFMDTLRQGLAERSDAVDCFVPLLQATGVLRNTTESVEVVESLYGWQLDKDKDRFVFQSSIWRSIRHRNIEPFENAWVTLNDQITKRSKAFSIPFTQAMALLGSALEQQIVSNQ